MSFPDVSVAMADDKLDAAVARGATTITSCDLSCLIHLEGRSWDDFLAGRSKRRRKKIRSEERRLGREHELVVRRTTSAPTDAAR